MEEAPENGKESSHSANANGMKMNERMSKAHEEKCVTVWKYGITTNTASMDY
jgi:hypothetical protein